MKLAALVRSSRIEVVPPGFLTIEQMAKREGFGSERAFSPTLREAIRLGFVEKKEFRVEWGRQVRPRPFYRYTKPKARAA